ncbi:lipid kinase YegS [Cobetia sp. 1AS1]|uniref:lipid kinase YegS n=1 Tax=Cobetia sp. 1AS1 TaxID=3040016 RepID=UPI00244CC461|nr:lipid kinase YegS [Cobetia sp. 1AS1]MDH2293112.1 lipid kinase YegS [Cobetia sp. 1AS1]
MESAARVRVILNGDKAQQPELREAIFAQRERMAGLEVRLTFEGDDVARLVSEAVDEGVTRLVVGGGDGTLNLIANALMQHPPAKRPEVAILPLGTANDLATSLGIPEPVTESLALACEGAARAVDVVQLDDAYFLNMASAGFGAEVTRSTPGGLKKLFGGGAYSLMGVLKAWDFRPYRGSVTLNGVEEELALFVLAIGNGRQAGGGQELAPRALLDDGCFDVLVIRDFPIARVGEVIEELESLPDNGHFVRYVRTDSLHYRGEALPVNLDGESYLIENSEFQLIPGAMRLVAPQDAALLTPS